MDVYQLPGRRMRKELLFKKIRKMDRKRDTDESTAPVGGQCFAREDQSVRTIRGGAGAASGSETRMRKF
jgi:hypothetical protein